MSVAGSVGATAEDEESSEGTVEVESFAWAMAKAGSHRETNAISGRYRCIKTPTTIPAWVNWGKWCVVDLSIAKAI